MLAGGSAVELDLNLVLKTLVVFTKNVEDLVTTEVVRDGSTLGQTLTKHGTGDDNAGLLAVRASTHGGGAVALVTEEGPVDLERLAQQVLGRVGVGRDLVEDLLGIEHTVVVTDTGVVAADDHVGAAVVLTEEGVQEGLTGAGVSHIERVASLDNLVGHKVLVDEGLDTVNTDISRDVSRLQVTDKGVDEDSITDLDSDLGEVLVGSVHGVTQLQGGDGVPSTLGELGAGLGRSLVDTSKSGRELTLGQHLDGTADVEVLLLLHQLHARVLHVKSGEDILALEVLVSLGHLVQVVHLHGGHSLLSVVEGDLLVSCLRTVK